MDDGYSIVALSWGPPVPPTNRLEHQARVSISDSDANGLLEVHLNVKIGGGMFNYDAGVIGTAASREEALRNFGDILWNKDGLVVGGAEGTKASVPIETYRTFR